MATAKPAAQISEPANQESVSIKSKDRFINRELSWLSFNQRVLEEASNRNHPLLERLRFLSISASNLDEFYMVRVAGLKGQVAANVSTLSQEGMTPRQQLDAISEEARGLMLRQQDSWSNMVDQLKHAHVTLVPPGELTQREKVWLDGWFL